jgi:hypothetical protein
MIERKGEEWEKEIVIERRRMIDGSWKEKGKSRA